MAEDDARNTVPGMVADMGRTLVSALPPAFVMLCLINLCFLAMTYWVLSHQADQRAALVQSLVDRCMAIALHAEPPK